MDFLKRYPNLVRVVREAHEKRNMSHGHDFNHAFAVANLAAVVRITLKKEV
mgnify:CR=1 FL=1